VFAATLLLAGRLQDRFGPFWISAAGSVLISLSFFLFSYTSSLHLLYFFYGVLGGVGTGFGYGTVVPVMAKWFPDKRGLAVGLAVAGYGGGSAIFGPLANLKLIPAYGVHTTFQILGGIFLVMTVIGAFLLKNPPTGWRPAGWTPPAPTAKSGATTHDFTPGEVLRTPTFYFMWVAYALGSLAGLMVISQLVPFAKSVGIPGAALATMGLVVGAVGNASGRILSGWMSDTLGRLNVLRLMIDAGGPQESPDQTVAEYQWAIAQKPDDRVLHYNYGLFLFEHNRAAAIDQLRQSRPWDGFPVFAPDGMLVE